MEYDSLDSQAEALYLTVPPARVVLLQALFESYEGVALVRTLDTAASLMCVCTTPSQREVCTRILESVKESIPWRAGPRPPEAAAVLIDGDFSKTS